MRKMFGARISDGAIAKIKLLSRATGLGEGETVERILNSYALSPEEARAVKALEEFDRARQAAARPAKKVK